MTARCRRRSTRATSSPSSRFPHPAFLHWRSRWSPARMSIARVPSAEHSRHWETGCIARFPDEAADALTVAGKFIVFEGGEGTGKSTQARLLADALGRAGVRVVLTREPGGAPGAELLRRLLVESPPSPGWEPLSEALLHYAARNEHLHRTIRPSLAGGAWV